MTLKLSDLTVSQQKLVKLVHRNLQYGQIKSLAVRNGEPDLQEELEVVVDNKIFEHRIAPPHPLTPNSVLNPKWRNFFDSLNGFQNGRISNVQFKNGVPDIFSQPTRLRVGDLQKGS